MTCPRRVGQLGDPHEKLFDCPDRQRVHRAGRRKSILKIASRRRAVRLVTDAAELLDCSHTGGASAAGTRIPSITVIPQFTLILRSSLTTRAIPIFTAAGHLPPTGGYYLEG